MITNMGAETTSLVDVMPPIWKPPAADCFDAATAATTCTTDTLSRTSSSSLSTTSMITFIPPNIATNTESFLQKTWKPVKKDILKIVEDDCALPLFQSLHDAGVKAPVLKALALLSKSDLPLLVREECIERFALYLSSNNDQSYHTKLGCIRTLMVLCSPIEASWQLEEGCLKEMLQFVTDRSQDWAFENHSEMMLLMELRAICLRYMELDDEAYRLEVEDVVKGSQVAAEYIAGAAKWVERGLKWSVPVIEGGLETAGDSLKGVMTPSSAKCSQAVTHCSGAAKKATNRVRETARHTASRVCEVSAQGIHMAATKMEPVTQRLVPHQECRDVIGAAGTVGMASIGAAAIVGEAVFETTKAVAQKTASVTADVVRYKYGTAAGQVIQDASDTTGNILRTMTHVAMLEARVVVKAAAKQSIKTQVRQQYVEEEDEHDDPLLFFDPTRANAMRVVQKLQGMKTIDDTRRVSLLDEEEGKAVYQHTVEI